METKTNTKKFNEPLLNKNKTTHIYLYRVKKNGKKKNTCGMENMKLPKKIINCIKGKMEL